MDFRLQTPARRNLPFHNTPYPFLRLTAIIEGVKPRNMNQNNLWKFKCKGKRPFWAHALLKNIIVRPINIHNFVKRMSNWNHVGLAKLRGCEDIRQRLFYDSQKSRPVRFVNYNSLHWSEYLKYFRQKLENILGPALHLALLHMHSHFIHCVGIRNKSSL